MLITIYPSITKLVWVDCAKKDRESKTEGERVTVCVRGRERQKKKEMGKKKGERNSGSKTKRGRKSE